ncbi:unnamed protein product [Zymoseptoria tritici ST99CH_1A5]|uniref:Major facilitator superfamily (MFS) profile domain-containing protein n=2 Tax=Zymoseptoria tritici TaxID=1047171 RepID=A0A2H1GNC5_ZYMTR|nr:unnamed protein product [Zymoseptoria tritici ST99CH_1E4]SMY25925.1 unnamed protein product [Zymoseptoria tritici ST99CH_1A5]
MNSERSSQTLARDSTPSQSKESNDLSKEQLEQYGVRVGDDNKVFWSDGAKDHPRNWSPWSKYYSAIIISWLELYMTGISSSGTAAANSARMEYGIQRNLAYFAFVSLYLIGQTVGGIFCSPISETFGRRTIYIIATAMFCVTSVVVAAVPSDLPGASAAIYIGRFFQGVAAAIPATVAFGNFEDMFDAEKRIWVVYLYTLAGMIGLVLGPIYSSYVLARTNWRWVFWISAIVSAISLGACFFIQESKASQLLQAKVDKIKKETGNDKLESNTYGGKFSVKEFVQNSLFRPLVFLFTEPIVTFCSILCAIAFGLIYGLTEGLTVAYTDPPFDQTFNETSSSLAFIAILIGEIINILPRFYDQHIFRKYRREGRRILPESKIASFAIACPALAIGLWIFAWTTPPRVTNVPWPVSMIGLIFIGFALNDFSYVLFGYATDSYGEYASSAVSAISLTRTLAAAIFPLFAYNMFSGLGTNIAATILAAVATLFAFTPFLFLKYGATLRKKSKKACNDEDALTEENDHMSDDQSQESQEKESA